MEVNVYPILLSDLKAFQMPQNVSLDKALEMAASQQSILQQLNDHREAIDALLEKRKAIYTNS